MYKVSTAVLFIFTLFLFSSCQKEITSTETPTVPISPVIGDSTLLLKYLEVDSIPGALQDTSKIVQFGYDAQKRLTSVYLTFTTDAVDNLNFYEKYTCQYNGADTLPARMMREFREGSDTLNFTFNRDTAYYTYNIAGKLISDSTRKNERNNFGEKRYYITKKFSYFTGYTLVAGSNDYNGSVELSLDSLAYTTSGNNTTSLNVHNYSLPGMQSTALFSFSFTYDNHVNPFHYLPGMHSIAPYFEYEGGPVNTLQPNNATIISQNDIRAGVTINESIAYSYKNNGYPSTFFSTQNSSSFGSTTRNYKGIFVYGLR